MPAGEEKEDGYIKTATNNYVSRSAVVENPGKVELKGKSVVQPGSIVRGDLAAIRMGRYCFIGTKQSCRLRHLEMLMFP